jgi:hypothetical protein
LGCAPEFNPDLSDLASEGTEGSDSGDETTDTETSSSTSEGDTTASTGDGDETGSTTGDGDTGGLEPLNPGDLCHPFNAILDNMPACPPQTHCVFDNWDQDNEHYAWTCQLTEGMGEYGEDCGWPLDVTACGEAHYCTQAGIFPEGECEFGSCCVEQCDVLNPSCSPGWECQPYGGDADMFPPFFADTDIPFIGTCAPQG